jgi:dihydropteroate synthase
MGIVNVTPDSFSGDGLTDPEAAVERGLAMVAAGADVIDVGGESTRPGHVPVSPSVEIARVLPVVSALASAGVLVSVDTSKVEVAEAAVDAGASMVNDVWGLQRAPAIARLAAARGLDLVLMHNQDGTEYETDILDAVKAALKRSLDSAVEAGVARERVILDPGIGFGKTAVQNMVVLRRLEELLELGQPILVGASRKSFLGRLFGQEMEARVWGTAAVVAASVLRGATWVRVHDVPEMAAVARVAEGLRDPSLEHALGKAAEGPTGPAP